MNDTRADIEKKYFDMLMALLPEQRVAMCSDMFDTARTMILSSFPDGLLELEKKKQLFLRLYGNEFSDERVKEEIFKNIK